MTKRTDERHNARGEEMLDPTPMQPPLGYKRVPSLSEQIRQQVLAHKLEQLEQLEETEEEADDFEVGDDFEPSSPHENDHVPTIKELKERVREINDEIKRQNMEKLRQELQEKQGKEKPSRAAEPPAQIETKTGE